MHGKNMLKGPHHEFQHIYMSRFFCDPVNSRNVALAVWSRHLPPFPTVAPHAFSLASPRPPTPLMSTTLSYCPRHYKQREGQRTLVLLFAPERRRREWPRRAGQGRAAGGAPRELRSRGGCNRYIYAQAVRPGQAHDKRHDNWVLVHLARSK